VPTPLTPVQPEEPIPFDGFAVFKVTVDALRYAIAPFAEICARLMDRCTVAPVGMECIAAIREQAESTLVPFTPTISSATWMPACRAGDGATTEFTIAPVGVAGVFQPSASNAATWAACFESLISK